MTEFLMTLRVPVFVVVPPQGLTCAPLSPNSERMVSLTRSVMSPLASKAARNPLGPESGGSSSAPVLPMVSVPLAKPLQ